VTCNYYVSKCRGSTTYTYATVSRIIKAHTKTISYAWNSPYWKFKHCYQQQLLQFEVNYKRNLISCNYACRNMCTLSIRSTLQPIILPQRVNVLLRCITGSVALIAVTALSAQRTGRYCREWSWTFSRLINNFVDITNPYLCHVITYEWSFFRSQWICSMLHWLWYSRIAY
jgi:hypothetical protein